MHTYTRVQAEARSLALHVAEYVPSRRRVSPSVPVAETIKSRRALTSPSRLASLQALRARSLSHASDTRVFKRFP